MEKLINLDEFNEYEKIANSPFFEVVKIQNRSTKKYYYATIYHTYMRMITFQQK